MSPAESVIQHRVGRQYIEEQINSLSPVELLVRTYDIAIAACERQDRERVSRALVELISALDFEQKDIALGLFRLYNFALKQAKSGRFDLVKPILTDLRDTWKQADPGACQ